MASRCRRRQHRCRIVAKGTVSAQRGLGSARRKSVEYGSSKAAAAASRRPRARAILRSASTSRRRDALSSTHHEPLRACTCARLSRDSRGHTLSWHYLLRPCIPDNPRVLAHTTNFITLVFGSTHTPLSLSFRYAVARRALSKLLVLIFYTRDTNVTPLRLGFLEFKSFRRRFWAYSHGV